MASKATTAAKAAPESPPPVVAADDPPTETQPATETQAVEAAPVEWSLWRYTGPGGRIYTHIPLTVFPGDVAYHQGVPAADGCWEPADGSDQAPKAPDNTRPDPAPPVLDGPTPSDIYAGQGGVNGG